MTNKGTNMSKEQDIISQLGELALASRLKRISESLMRDVSRVYSELDYHFEARWFSLSYLLLNRKEIAVTIAADELGLTHPAINQIANQMTKAGLLMSKKDKIDERKRILYLTPKGKKVLKQLDPLWKTIRICNAELIDEVSRNFLGNLDKLENALTKKSMYTRIIESLQNEIYRSIQIHPYTKKYASYFSKLNKAWLKKYFKIEEYDKLVLDNPDSQIIKKGGAVFFAEYDGKIVGCSALLKHPDSIYEIAKVAVLEDYQNKHIGRKLVVAAVDEAIRQKAKEICMLTNPELTASVKMFSNLGFELSSKNRFEKMYQRKTIYMKLNKGNYRKLKPKE